MKVCLSIAVLGFSAVACAQDAAAPLRRPPAPTMPAASVPATPPAATDPKITDTLKILEARGDTLKDFQAKLRYEVEHVRQGDTEVNRGRAAFVKDVGAGRIAIVLDDLVISGAVAQKDLNHQIVFDGTWLYERDPRKKIFRKIQLVSAKAKADPFKLRGPLPMPIGQKAEAVLGDFAVTLIPTAEKDPANTVHLKLVPKKEGVFDFKALELWVDTAPEVQIPVKLQRTGMDDNVTTITLREMKVNQGGVEKLPIFDVKEPPKSEGWAIDVKPIAD